MDMTCQAKNCDAAAKQVVFVFEDSGQRTLRATIDVYMCGKHAHGATLTRLVGKDAWASIREHLRLCGLQAPPKEQFRIELFTEKSAQAQS